MKQRCPTPPRGAHADMKPADALLIVEGFTHDLNFDSDKLSRLLLLLHWMAYTAEWTEADSLCTEAEMAFGGFIDGTEEVIEGQMRRQLDALRKGGQS